MLNFKEKMEIIKQNPALWIFAINSLILGVGNVMGCLLLGRREKKLGEYLSFFFFFPENVV